MKETLLSFTNSHFVQLSKFSCRKLRLWIHDTKSILLRIMFCIFLQLFFYHDSSIKILTYFILNCRTRKKDSSNRQLSQTTFKQFFIIYKESGVDCSEDVEVCNVLKIRERLTSISIVSASGNSGDDERPATTTDPN